MANLVTSLKKNSKIKQVYKKWNERYFRYLYKISPVYASKYLYFVCTGKKLNLKNPQNFNEKLQWLKLYWQNPLIVKCADKYGIYEYVKSCGNEEILNELYGVYESTSEINWDKLPNKFALKCTHGCGYNVIANNKNELNQKEVFNKINKWLGESYGYRAAEIHYDKIEPRIIVERYIETDAGLMPNDYKIYCFNGKAKLALVCSDRGTKLKLNFVDLDWNRLDIGIPSFSSPEMPSKPSCFDQMIKYAENLSKPFPFVRVDFYDYNGKPILGEMTFTPAGCMATYYNDKGLKQLGDMLVLPHEKAS